MYRVIISTVSIGALFLSSVPAAAGTVEAPQAASQAMLDALRDVSGVPGFGAAVWQDGRITWTGSTGMRDVERGLPVEGDTRFRLASVSKLFATTALTRLAEQGLVDLDSPVAEQLPWLSTGWPAITPRQLAAHVSGLPHYQAVDEGRGTRPYASAREAVGIFADRPLLSQPGTAYSYSSWGYTLLGALVEEATATPFPDYVSQTLVPGLDVGQDATDSPDIRASAAYELGPDGPRRAQPHDYSYSWAGAGMMASAAGLARFGGAMLQDGIVSRRAFDAMLEPVLLRSGEAAGDDDFRVGFGWRIATDSDGHGMVFHNGAAIGARSALVLWREQGVAVSLLSNAAWVSSIEQTAAMLAAPILSAPVGLTERTCPVAARSYSGRFGSADISGAVRFVMRDGRCEGEVGLDAALKDYFTQGSPRVGGAMRIIGIDPTGGLSRAGLITPYGIYDLRAGEGGRLVASFSRTRSLELDLID